MATELKIEDVRVIVGDRIREITPSDVAELFAHMDSRQQAQFFNRVAEISAAWEAGGLYTQLQSITDEEGLSAEGRLLMRLIGEYSEPTR